jgi:hypothetical protein
MTASFTYDPVSRRSTKTINGQITQYLHDADDLAQEAHAGEVISYLMGLSVDEPGSRGGQEFYLEDG